MKLRMDGTGTDGWKERGASLLELLVFVAISMFVLSGIYNAYISFHTGMIRTQAKVRVQDDVRRVLEQALRELRMAGYGIATVTAPVPLSAVTAASPTSITIVTNDSALSTTLTAAANAGATALSVASLAGFQVNDAVYVTDGATYESATVTGVGASLSITPPLTANFGTGATIERQPRPITYTYTGGTLYRDPGDGSGPQPVLADVSAVNFSHFDGTNNPVVMPGGDVTTIRRVEIEISVTTSGVAQSVQAFNVKSDAWIRN